MVSGLFNRRARSLSMSTNIPAPNSILALVSFRFKKYRRVASTSKTWSLKSARMENSDSVSSPGGGGCV